MVGVPVAEAKPESAQPPVNSDVGSLPSSLQARGVVLEQRLAVAGLDQRQELAGDLELAPLVPGTKLFAMISSTFGHGRCAIGRRDEAQIDLALAPRAPPC